MFSWFRKKKTETKVQQKQYVDQRGARAGGDIVGGNKYSTYPSDSTLDTTTLILTNPIIYDNVSPASESDSCSSSSYDSSSSSSYDSGSSSCDSSSSSDSSF